MFNSPGMQSMMQQLLSNPQMMQNTMQAPIFQAMAANPELARQASIIIIIIIITIFNARAIA
jgi:hypothetical protein